MKGQIHGQATLLLPTEGTNQIVLREKLTMSVARILWCSRESTIVVLTKGIDERVACFAVIDAVKPELLHEAVLQCLVRALDTSFSRGGVGANHVDVEVLHRTAELRVSNATYRFLPVDAENRMFVAVERDRLAMAPQIRTFPSQAL